MQQSIGVILIIYGIFKLYRFFTKKHDTKGYGTYFVIRAFGGAIAAIVLGLIFLLDW